MCQHDIDNHLTNIKMIEFNQELILWNFLGANFVTLSKLDHFFIEQKFFLLHWNGLTFEKEWVKLIQTVFIGLAPGLSSGLGNATTESQCRKNDG